MPIRKVNDIVQDIVNLLWNSKNSRPQSDLRVIQGIRELVREQSISCIEESAESERATHSGYIEAVAMKEILDLKKKL